MFFCGNFQLRRLLSPQLQLAELESCQVCPVKLRAAAFGGQMFLCHPAMPSTDYKSKCPGKSLGLILLLGELNGCMSCSGMFQLEV